MKNLLKNLKTLAVTATPKGGAAVAVATVAGVKDVKITASSSSAKTKFLV